MTEAFGGTDFFVEAPKDLKGALDEANELPRPGARQHRDLAGLRQEATAILAGTAERLRRFPPRNRNEPAHRSSPSMRRFCSVLRPLTQRKQPLWHTLCRAGG
jgi:hypothetical protein